MTIRRKKTASELLAERNAKAVKTMKKLQGAIGSPYRIHEAIKNKGKPKPNK